jgi:ParB-like chromosome segregation protein Spo0J
MSTPTKKSIMTPLILDDRPPVHEMQSHRAAEIFPTMAGADFEALVDDIRQHGQREPIVVHDGLILDGRNRYKACLQLGIKPLTAEWDGSSTPEAFVISMNIHRRHLGSGQRAMIAKRLATLSHGQKKADAQICASSQAEAAELLKVSRRSVQHASVVQEKAVPELAEAVDRGDIPVSTAAQLVNLPKARQREIAKARGKLAPRLAAKSARRMRTAKASRAYYTQLLNPTPKETEHDRDLRILRDTWVATCESAKAAFLKEQAAKERNAYLLSIHQKTP